MTSATRFIDVVIDSIYLSFFVGMETSEVIFLVFEVKICDWPIALMGSSLEVYYEFA